jgi:hypothetical protein
LLGVGAVCLLAGCPSGPPASGGPKSPRGEGKPSREKGPVCLVNVGKVAEAARKSSAFDHVWKEIAKLKKELQARIDEMVKAYRERFELDIQAANYLKKEKKLEKERGSVLSEEEYQKRMKKLEEELEGNDALRQAVKEQREKTPEYQLRHKQAMMNAKRIATEGKRLQLELQARANELAAPLSRKVEQAIQTGLSRQVKKGGCGVVCDPATGKLLGHRGPREEAAPRCHKGTRKGTPRTDEVSRFVLDALKEAAESKAPATGSESGEDEKTPPGGGAGTPQTDEPAPASGAPEGSGAEESETPWES